MEDKSALEQLKLINELESEDKANAAKSAILPDVVSFCDVVLGSHRL